MNLLTPALVAITRDLRAVDHRFALVGGLAVSSRVEARFTKDADLAVSVADDADAESLTRALLGAGWRVQAAVEHEQTHRLATVRLVHRDNAFHGALVDLLFASCGVEPEIVACAEGLPAVEVGPGLSLPVAASGHLLAMKILSRVPERENDHPDVVRLCRSASEVERSRARDAVRLIADRGYDRGRDVVALLDEALAQFGAQPNDGS